MTHRESLLRVHLTTSSVSERLIRHFLTTSELTCNSIEDFEKWAYKIEEEEDDSNCEMHDNHGLGPALASLKLSSEAAPEGPINCYAIWHQDNDKKDASGNRIDGKDQTYTADGRTYRVRDHPYHKRRLIRSTNLHHH